jgi:hypothetical protein
MSNEEINNIYSREIDRMGAIKEMIQDYLSTIDPDEVEGHNMQKWAAHELIIFLAVEVGETHYEMVGILDEVKWDLRKRSHKALDCDND